MSDTSDESVLREEPNKVIEPKTVPQMMLEDSRDSFAEFAGTQAMTPQIYADVHIGQLGKLMNDTSTFTAALRGSREHSERIRNESSFLRPRSYNDDNDPVRKPIAP